VPVVVSAAGSMRGASVVRRGAHRHDEAPKVGTRHDNGGRGIDGAGRRPSIGGRRGVCHLTKRRK
jgi:hypothetical protein